MDEDKKAVNVSIEVSADKAEAYITLIPLTENPDFSVVQIRDALSKRGIVSGIKKEVLDRFGKNITYNERILIASGEKPVEGEDGKIEYSFESGKTVKVKKGDTVGEIIHPSEGVSGKTVLGDTIAPKQVNNAKIPRLTNVKISPENENKLIAEIDGYLLIDHMGVQLTPFFELELSDDKYEAYIRVNKPLNDVNLNAEDLKRFLAEKGIVYGINEEDVENIFKAAVFDRFNEKLLIASGKMPEEVKDGRIEYSVDSEKTVPVKKGDTIGEIIHPIDGVDGITVFNEKIPPRQVQKAIVPKLSNIIVSPENEDVLIAEIDGYVLIDQVSIQVTPFFEIEISEDKYEAFATVTKPLNEGDIVAADLKIFLAEKGITYGVLDEEIENILKQELFDKSVLVARGKKVVNGKDGEIKYFFETEIKPKMDENGNIDYKELNIIQNVHEGAKLAEIIPPEPGVKGVTIYNEIIAPQLGEQPSLPIGKNTRPGPDNPNVLLSEIEGSVKLKGTVVDVELVITIRENVDFSTGNIDFIGPVIVNGDVKSGFKIKSQSDVQVNGVVEDAVIESGGNVLLKTGFIGRGHGEITAQGEVTAKFCENQTITAKGSIHISEYAMQSNIQTSDTLTITEKNGLIVGGETYAVKGIRAKTAGNDNYTPTALFAGVDKEFNEKLHLVKESLTGIIENQKNIDRVLQKSVRMKLVKKTLPEETINMLNKVKTIKDEKEIEKKKTVIEIEKLKSKIDEYKEAKVEILDVVYPETTITIYDKHIKVNEPRKSLYFTYGEEKLIAIDLSDLAEQNNSS
ncbi:flagellar assembly protein A [Candidatus Latescibacterota bacterium]